MDALRAYLDGNEPFGSQPYFQIDTNNGMIFRTPISEIDQAEIWYHMRHDDSRSFIVFYTRSSITTEFYEDTRYEVLWKKG